MTLIGALSYLFDGDLEGWLAVSAGLVCGWLMVRGLRRQERLVAQLQAAQAHLSRQAAAAERRRIAGEVHDVAAHSLAVTMLHLTGARLLLQRSGADSRAVEALAEAERQGRRSLDDVRRAVGLLGAAPEDFQKGDSLGWTGVAAPWSGGGELLALVDQYRAASLAVTLRLTGNLGQLPAPVATALHRTLQGALANAVKHAPGAEVAVELEIGAAARLRVQNSRPAPGALRTPGAAAAPSAALSDGATGLGATGLGIGGMRERARLLGGTLDARPIDDGWMVECRLPLPAAAERDPQARQAMPA